MYTIKHDASSDTKSIVDPAGRELVSIEDLHNELIELLHRAGRAESIADHWERRAKERPPIDWNRIRIDAAIAAMHGMFASDEWSAQSIAQSAINYSSQLVAKLKNEVEE